jgi:hypothetical protein
VLDQLPQHLADVIRLIGYPRHGCAVDQAEVTRDDDLRFDLGVGTQRDGEETATSRSGRSAPSEMFDTTEIAARRSCDLRSPSAGMSAVMDEM